jgi:hypothetical protein
MTAAVVQRRAPEEASVVRSLGMLIFFWLACRTAQHFLTIDYNPRLRRRTRKLSGPAPSPPVRNSDRTPRGSICLQGMTGVAKFSPGSGHGPGSWSSLPITAAIWRCLPADSGFRPNGCRNML